MTKILEKKSLLEEVDLIEDREYILEKLRESKQRYENGGKTYTLEESYDLNMDYLDNLEKEYARV